MMEEKGCLYLIPAPLGGDDPAEVIPAPVLERLCSLRTFVVEEVRTARRYLSAAGLKGRIDECTFLTLNEHTRDEEVQDLARLFTGGNEVGLLSEAGLPAVADPGARLVALCHREGIPVIPLVGPSSLMLALMGSGLNGQSFAFCGYLPAKPDARRQALRSIERHSAATGQTQLFIETPYRNDALLADILSVCQGKTRLCIAADLTLPDAFLRTRTVAQWKQSPVTIGKRPCVFLLLAS